MKSKSHGMNPYLNDAWKSIGGESPVSEGARGDLLTVALGVEPGTGHTHESSEKEKLM